jgi:hypothetical protein
MSMPTSNTILTGLLAGPIVAAYNQTQAKSSFTNVHQKENFTSESSFMLIVIIIALLIVFMSCKATYNLTDSLLQSILCFLFGGLYMYIAFLYYGFSGYKFKLSNGSSNSRH